MKKNPINLYKWILIISILVYFKVKTRNLKPFSKIVDQLQNHLAIHHHYLNFHQVFYIFIRFFIRLLSYPVLFDKFMRDGDVEKLTVSFCMTLLLLIGPFFIFKVGLSSLSCISASFKYISILHGNICNLSGINASFRYKLFQYFLYRFV